MDFVCHSLGEIHHTIGVLLFEMKTLMTKRNSKPIEESKTDIKEKHKEDEIFASQLSSLFDRYGRMLVDTAPLLVEYSKPSVVEGGNKIKKIEMRDTFCDGLSLNVCVSNKVPIMPNQSDLKKLSSLIEGGSDGSLRIHTFIDGGHLATVDENGQTE